MDWNWLEKQLQSNEWTVQYVDWGNFTGAEGFWTGLSLDRRTQVEYNWLDYQLTTSLCQISQEQLATGGQVEKLTTWLKDYYRTITIVTSSDGMSQLSVRHHTYCTWDALKGWMMKMKNLIASQAGLHTPMGTITNALLILQTHCFLSLSSFTASRPSSSSIP